MENFFKRPKINRPKQLIVSKEDGGYKVEAEYEENSNIKNNVMHIHRTNSILYPSLNEIMLG